MSAKTVNTNYVYKMKENIDILANDQRQTCDANKDLDKQIDKIKRMSSY